jgi:hypothetical protein
MSTPIRKGLAPECAFDAPGVPEQPQPREVIYLWFLEGGMGTMKGRNLL